MCRRVFIQYQICWFVTMRSLHGQWPGNCKSDDQRHVWFVTSCGMVYYHALYGQWRERIEPDMSNYLVGCPVILPSMRLLCSSWHFGLSSISQNIRTHTTPLLFLLLLVLPPTYLPYLNLLNFFSLRSSSSLMIFLLFLASLLSLYQPPLRVYPRLP